MQKAIPLVPVRYVGQNENGYSDHLYSSGGVWPFPEAVAEVPADKAIKLLDHSEFEDARDDTSVPLKALLLPDVKAEPKKEQEEELAQEAPLADLSTMTKAQLRQYAQRNFGIELPDTAKKDELIDAVRLQMGKAPQ